MNNIDIDLILKKVEDVNKNKYMVINNLLERVDKYEGLENEHKRLMDTLKSVDISKKIMFVVEIFIASNYSISSRNMEKLLKEQHEINDKVPLISKSAIDRYLRNKELIISHYGEDIYTRICASRIVITERSRIARRK